tara:strand:+ start:7149 stop:7433 length:285 start_codon:yes stop_codon:yes gene_type:complete
MAEHKIVDGVAVPLSDYDKAQLVIDAADALDKAPARIMSDIRAKRDTALAATDWAALPDSPTMSDAMTTYRTALRDYPATYASDNSAAFPELGE